MSSDRQQTSDDWDAMIKQKTAPVALTREQVERMKRDGFVPDIHRVLDSHETLRQALAQQAQEVERLTKETAKYKALLLQSCTDLPFQEAMRAAYQEVKKTT